MSGPLLNALVEFVFHQCSFWGSLAMIPAARKFLFTYSTACHDCLFGILLLNDTRNCTL